MTKEIQPLVLEIKTSDGKLLSGRLYSAGSPKRAVIVIGAMGVTQNFYRPFAEFLASQGCTTLTLDFRGMGESLKEPLSKVDTDIVRWARIDFEAALQELVLRVPEAPITWIGHSLGGQVIPLTPGHEKVLKFITVACGSGWWKENSPELKRRVWLLWYGVAPVLTKVFGYFPGARLKMVGDLPKGVIRQWRRWCLNPQYLLGVEGQEIKSLYSSFKLPITSLSFTDDEMMSEANVNSLHGFYTSAPKKMLRFSPEELGKKRIGHLGFFKRGNEDLWEKLVLPEL